ncbi:MAG: hypothetical protein ACRCZI_01500, partial [Cetobacterium sp.]
MDNTIENNVKLNTINNIYTDYVTKRICESINNDQLISSNIDNDSLIQTINNTISQDINSELTKVQISLQNNEHFYSIINSFCNSLVEFALSIKQPTNDISNLIYKKYSRDSSFDNYVQSVEKFTNIIQTIISLLKSVIISLNQLFVIRSVDKITIFMSHLRNFLHYLLVEDVFLKLTMLRREIGNKHKNDVEILQKIKIIKTVMYRIVNISIDITSLIIPQLSVIKEIVEVFNDKLEDDLDIKIGEISRMNNNLDNIIKQLVNIQLRSSIIESFQNRDILNFLNNYDTRRLVTISENLHAEYVSLLHTVLSLQSSIGIYKRKKKNV